MTSVFATSLRWVAWGAVNLKFGWLGHNSIGPVNNLPIYFISIALKYYWYRWQSRIVVRWFLKSHYDLWKDLSGVHCKIVSSWVLSSLISTFIFKSNHFIDVLQLGGWITITQSFILKLNKEKQIKEFLNLFVFAKTRGNLSADRSRPVTDWSRSAGTS